MYDRELAARYRQALGDTPGLSEKRMMGGLCFFINGNMIGGADRSRTGERRLMFRVGKGLADAAERLPGGEPMVLGGRPMPGFYFVRDECCDDDALAQWIVLALAHAASLPPK